MLGARRDKMATPGRGMTTRQPENGEVATLRPTGGEDELMRLSSKQGSHPISGIIHNGAGATARRVDAGGISQEILQPRKHRHPRLAAERRCSVVIEIDHSREIGV